MGLRSNQMGYLSLIGQCSRQTQLMINKWVQGERLVVVSLSMPNGMESYDTQDKHKTKFIENTKVTKI